MDRNPWKRIYMTLMVLIALLLVVSIYASTILADDSGMPPGPPPGPPPSVQSLVQGDYLYVLDMRAIHQYYLSDLTTPKQTVSLPDPPAPPIQATADGRPPMPPHASMLIATKASDESEPLLLVFEMRSIYKFKLPSLDPVLPPTILPTPELPQ